MNPPCTTTESACACDSACKVEGHAPGGSGIEPVAKIALASTGATIAACAMCCVVPLAWPAAALALSAGAAAWFERAQEPLTWLSALLVAAAWWMTWRKKGRVRQRPARSTIAVLILSTLLLGVAMCWNTVEPWLVKAMS